jgi:hypothetical protein
VSRSGRRTASVFIKDVRGDDLSLASYLRNEEPELDAGTLN